MGSVSLSPIPPDDGGDREARPSVSPLGELVERVSSRLFGAGWLFFVPYLALYLLALAIGLSSASLRSVFWILHVAFGALLVARAVEAARRKTSRDLLSSGTLWFWGGLFALFLLPGAYLEFPADPWEHVRRLNAWPPDLPVRSAVFAHRFAYFWGFTFLSVVDPSRSRLVLDLLSGFWQLLLAFQFHRLARRLGFTETWSRLQVLGVVALFGNGEFSFLRYYALSSTPLAYVAYLSAAIAILDLLERPFAWARPVLTLGGCVALIVLDHPQELLFLVLFGLCAGVVKTWGGESRARRRLLLGAGAAVFVAGLVAGRVLMRDPISHGIDPYRFYFPFVSRLATFRLWDPHLDYLRTLGAGGLVALAMAVVFRRDHPILACLVLAPILLLSFPPLALAFSYASSIRNSYRLLYVLPVSFMLVAGLQSFLSRRRWPRAGRLFWPPIVVLAILSSLGLRSSAPAYGKLRFQLFQPPPALTGAAIDPVVRWFRENRELDRTCVVTSDPVTEWMVAAWLGREPGTDRVSGYRWLSLSDFAPWTIHGPEDLLYYASTHAVCGFLVERSPEYGGDSGVRSWVGAASGHWTADAASPRARVPPGFVGAAEKLLDHGWRRTFVPPSYWYYEPPRAE
jgi:hypothetical protein